jgi:hypothetical protein
VWAEFLSDRRQSDYAVVVNQYRERAMARREINLEFQVQSTDPQRSSSKAVTEILKLSPELEAAISDRLPGATVRIRRAEGVPGLPELQHILLQIDWDAVRKGAEGAASGFVVTQFLNLLKTRIKLLYAKKVSAPAKAPATKKGSAAKKTLSAAKKTKSAPAKKKSKKR